MIHRSALKRLAENHEATVKKTQPILEAPGGVQERRIAKAQRAKLTAENLALELRHQEISESIKRSQKIIESKKKDFLIRHDRLKQARQRLEYQRKAKATSEPCHHMAVSPSLTTHLSDIRQQIAADERCWDKVIKDLTTVRRILISQLISIYPITHRQTEMHDPARTSQRLSTSTQKPLERLSKPMARRAWHISGLCLPTSTELKGRFLFLCHIPLLHLMLTYVPYLQLIHVRKFQQQHFMLPIF